MADTKISGLDELTVGNLASGDWIPIVDVSDSSMSPSGTTKKLAASAVVQTANNQTIAGNKTFDDIVYLNNLLVLSSGTATISNGEITATASLMTVNTEDNASSDDLNRINGFVDGAVIILRTIHPNRDVVIKHDTGNIVNNGMTDFTLSHPRDFWIGVYNDAFARWCGLGVNCFP